MSKYFVITTNKETALQIEGFFNSQVLSAKRSIKLGHVSHFQSYSTLQIIANSDNGLMNPVDIFWLGFYSATL